VFVIIGEFGGDPGPRRQYRAVTTVQQGIPVAITLWTVGNRGRWLVEVLVGHSSGDAAVGGDQDPFQPIEHQEPRLGLRLPGTELTELRLLHSHQLGQTRSREELPAGQNARR
jgi:hypothetical protein